MKIAISELEHLRQEVKNCHQIIKDMQKKRPWVGLTDEAIWEIHDRCIPPTEGYVSPVDFARAIEAKLKERNT